MPAPKRKSRRIEAEEGGGGENGIQHGTKAPATRVDASTSNTVGEEKSGNPGVSFTTLLQQAVESADAERLGEILRRGDLQPKVVQKTVERMPVTAIVPFLELTQATLDDPVMMKDPRPWLEWVYTVLVTHATYLSSIANLDKRIGRLVEWMEKRAANMDKLLQLQGKLELVVNQMEVRSKPVLYAHQEPMVVFNAGERPEDPEAKKRSRETEDTEDEDTEEMEEDDPSQWGEEDEDEAEEDGDGDEVGDNYY